MFEDYPKWKYDGMEGILVNDAEEEAALGSGYADAPSETPVVIKKKAKE